MGQKMCGKWGKASQTGPQSAVPLWKGPGVFIHYCRLLTFLAWPPEVPRKEAEPSSGERCWTPRSLFQVLKCSFTFFATTPHTARLENQSMQPQALSRAETIKAKLLVNRGLGRMLRRRRASEIWNQKTYSMFNISFEPLSSRIILKHKISSSGLKCSI